MCGGRLDPGWSSTCRCVKADETPGYHWWHTCYPPRDFKPVQGMRQTSYGSLAAVVRALGLKPSRKAATNVRKLVRKGHTEETWMPAAEADSEAAAPPSTRRTSSGSQERRVTGRKRPVPADSAVSSETMDSLEQQLPPEERLPDEAIPNYPRKYSFRGSKRQALDTTQAGSEPADSLDKWLYTAGRSAGKDLSRLPGKHNSKGGRQCKMRSLSDLAKELTDAPGVQGVAEEERRRERNAWGQVYKQGAQEAAAAEEQPPVTAAADAGVYAQNLPLGSNCSMQEADQHSQGTSADNGLMYNAWLASVVEEGSISMDNVPLAARTAATQLPPGHATPLAGAEAAAMKLPPDGALLLPGSPAGVNEAQAGNVPNSVKTADAPNKHAEELPAVPVGSRVPELAVAPTSAAKTAQKKPETKVHAIAGLPGNMCLEGNRVDASGDNEVMSGETEEIRGVVAPVSRASAALGQVLGGGQLSDEAWEFTRELQVNNRYLRAQLALGQRQLAAKQRELESIGELILAAVQGGRSSGAPN
ncbi:hypothetical protein WJX75_005045 [Coccomyxa subellipsoidea]|uniref:Uncharacterized protein n=1 Tax=Coccomyxa subellipsoidea TaxID=248742 RepID=A0ABR2YGE7_9CHLO